MSAIHSAGEIGISTDKLDFLFRPSLSAIAKIGSPTEILDVFVSLLSKPLFDFEARAQLRNALIVMNCCADNTDDLDAITGGFYGDSLEYKAGAIEKDELITLAAHLIRHGVAGVSANDDAPLVKGEPMREFDAARFVAMAVAHLGLAEQDAWRMTMTSLLAALNSKFPRDTTSATSITEKEYADSMDWLAKVNAKRGGGKK